MQRRWIGWFYAMGLLALMVGGSAAIAADSGTIPKNAEIAILRNPGTPAAGAADADGDLPSGQPARSSQQSRKAVSA